MPLTTVNPAMIGQTSTGAASLTATGSAAASLVTAAGTALSADSSGRVTTPNQPAFYAYSSGSSMTSGNKVAFNNAALNVGSSFNTSTNTFTAPITGNYLLAAIVRFDQNSVLYGQTSLYVNGSAVYQGHYNNTTNANNTYNSAPAIALLTLAAGDTVYVRADVNGSGTLNFSGTESLFYGYLLG